MIVSRSRWWVRSEAGAIALAAAALTGCDTMSQDFNDLAASIKPTSPTEAAKDMLDPYDADKRRTGTVLISNAPWGGTEVYVKAYRDMVLNERDPIVKATAIRALARWGTPEDAIIIAGHDGANLTAESVQVRWEAAKGLQRLHNPVVVPYLLATMSRDSERTDVRVATASALAQYPEDRVFQGLVAALDARELAVNTTAELSLHTLTGESFGMDRSAWLLWYGQATKQGGAFAGQSDYFYPTYWREDTFWEKMAFWSSRHFEKPNQPAGLRPSTETRTYTDSDQPPPLSPATQ